MKENDIQHLASYRQKQQTVIDRVKGIISRRHNGLYVWGDTGVGKTWNIEATLKEAQEEGIRSFKKLSGKCTPLGLFEMARDFTDAIIFVDDDPMLVKDSLSQQMLLHLCGDGRLNPDTGRNERLVTNVKSKTRESCLFTGSVIISNNVRLANMPVLRALQGRIRTYHFRPTTSELVAKLRHLAETIDHPYTDLGERREICEYIISQAEHSQQQIDLRLLKHGLSDYEQYMRGEAAIHWKELIVSSMQDYYAPVPTLGREERKTHEQDHILALIEDLTESGGSKEVVVEQWMQVNQKKKTAFYDRLKELPEEWQRRFKALPDKRSTAPSTETYPVEIADYARELIDDFPYLAQKSRAWMVKDWANFCHRPESEFPVALKSLGADWEERFLALPA
jgi:hypothetical protein